MAEKEERITNMKFSKMDKPFIQACTKANIPPTQRQASKYRNKKGLAYKTGRGK